MTPAEQQCRFPLFAGLTSAQWHALQARMRRDEWPADSPIINQGDVAHRFFLIEAGRVNVVLYTEEGEEVILGVLSVGEYFGEMGLLDGQPRSASIVAVEPSRTLSLDREQFLTFLREIPDAAMNIFRGLCERLRFADRRIEDLATLDLAGRLVRVLEELTSRNGERMAQGIALPRRMTHQDLAGMVGASRARVTKTLAFLRRRGVVQRDKGRLILRTRGNQ